MLVLGFFFCWWVKGLKDGSTAIVAILRQDQLYVANTGDSRAIVCEDATPIPLSTDHKPMDLKEMNRIRAAGGDVFLGRVQGILAVARAFGDIDFKGESGETGFITCEPDIKMWTINEKTEFIVLACDGVWDVMSNYDVVKFVREKLLQGLSPQTVTEQLVLQCFHRGSMDNISAIIVSFLTPSKIHHIHATKNLEVKKIIPDRVLIIDSMDNIDMVKKQPKSSESRRIVRSPRHSRLNSLVTDDLPNLNPTPVIAPIDIQNLLEPVIPPPPVASEAITIRERSSSNGSGGTLSQSGRKLLSMNSPPSKSANSLQPMGNNINKSSPFKHNSLIARQNITWDVHFTLFWKVTKEKNCK